MKAFQSVNFTSRRHAYEQTSSVLRNRSDNRYALTLTSANSSIFCLLQNTTVCTLEQNLSLPPPLDALTSLKQVELYPHQLWCRFNLSWARSKLNAVYFLRIRMTHSYRSGVPRSTEHKLSYQNRTWSPNVIAVRAVER